MFTITNEIDLQNWVRALLLVNPELMTRIRLYLSIDLKGEAFLLKAAASKEAQETIPIEISGIFCGLCSDKQEQDTLWRVLTQYKVLVQETARIFELHIDYVETELEQKITLLAYLGEEQARIEEVFETDESNVFQFEGNSYLVVDDEVADEEIREKLSSELSSWVSAERLMQFSIVGRNVLNVILESNLQPEEKNEALLKLLRDPEELLKDLVAEFGREPLSIDNIEGELNGLFIYRIA